MYKILVADDHEVVRLGLKLLISEESDMVVAKEAATAHDALASVRKEKFDAAVLDITLPGKNGVDLIKELLSLCPTLPVLVLTIHPEEQYARRMLKAGAKGYLTKGSPGKEIIRAIRKICRGGTYMSESLAKQLALDRASGVVHPPHIGLSDREFQVLTLIASGKTVTEVAEQLSLSVKTVSTYRVRILQKMGMRTSAELTRYAISNKLV
jgi:two-component system invasion response regulator UvrY